MSDDGANNALSNTATSTVTVAFAPLVNTGPEITFSENNDNTPVLVAASASILDIDSTQLSGKQ